MSAENPQKPSLELKKETSKEDVFSELFQTGTIIEIRREDIPQVVLAHFEGMSSRFIDQEEYTEGAFTVYYLIQHTDIPHLKTYVAEQDKIYDRLKKSKSLEKNVYFYDIQEDKKVGHGELRYQPNSRRVYFKDRPFIGYNKTEKNFLKMGYGAKRLLEMGAYSEMQWGLPLYSGDQNKEADRVWQKLVREGKAEEATANHPTRKRYRLTL